MTDHVKSTRRPRNAMPDDVLEALKRRKLEKAFSERPDYQQNDYIGWICRAKREETRRRRLRQMLDELAAGGVYMKMKHPRSARR